VFFTPRGNTAIEIRESPVVIVVMGVSGCGKTTIGELLAGKLCCAFYDGDAFHPQSNIEKMASGRPLTDADRMPWLIRLNDLILTHQASKSDAVLACSALKRAYREILRRNTADVCFVYLKGSYELIAGRMRQRDGHYMKVDMLRSQFDTLEEPDDAMVIDINDNPAALVTKIMRIMSAKA
jgi:gluconokinase